MFSILKRTTAGFRATLGTALKNETSGELVYIPPQSADEIIRHMTALERFINEPDEQELDPLIRMAIIHHQFESIHPFSDGNGRIGRIINVLYLAQQHLLDIPILYLSRYVTAHKADYYRHLQSVRDTGQWEPWLLYMLRAVGNTAVGTLELIEGIKALMTAYKNRLRTDHPRLYSQDLLNNLFGHPIRASSSSRTNSASPARPPHVTWTSSPLEVCWSSSRPGATTTTSTGHSCSCSPTVKEHVQFRGHSSSLEGISGSSPTAPDPIRPIAYYLRDALPAQPHHPLGQHRVDRGVNARHLAPPIRLPRGGGDRPRHFARTHGRTRRPSGEQPQRHGARVTRSGHSIVRCRRIQ